MNTYEGQTRQELRKRMNGHRDAFDNDPEIFEKSGAAQHAYLDHPELETPPQLKDFKLGVVKQVPSPMLLDREEFKPIERHRTNTKGLNRCRVA